MLNKLKRFIAGITIRTRHTWQNQDQKIRVAYFEDNSMIIELTPSKGGSPLSVCMNPMYVDKTIKWLNTMYKAQKEDASNVKPTAGNRYTKHGEKILRLSKSFPISKSETSTDRDPPDSAG